MTGNGPDPFLRAKLMSLIMNSPSKEIQCLDPLTFRPNSNCFILVEVKRTAGLEYFCTMNQPTFFFLLFDFSFNFLNALVHL